MMITATTTSYDDNYDVVAGCLVDGGDLRRLLATAERDPAVAGVRRVAGGVALLPIGVLRRARGRDELDRLQSVSVRVDERQLPQGVPTRAPVPRGAAELAMRE